jgi:hypothetical protein
MIVLFTYALGKQPEYETEKDREAYLYGKGHWGRVILPSL